MLPDVYGSIDRIGLRTLFFRQNFSVLSPRSMSILIVNKCVFVRKKCRVEDIHELVCSLMRIFSDERPQFS